MTSALSQAANRILPALVTPLTEQCTLDEVSLERLIHHLYEQQVGGLYVTGSTGEGVYLEADVRRRIVEIAAGLSRGHGQVIVHVGATEGALACELAAHAQRIGADAVASIPPFVGGYAWHEVLDYYRQLTQATTLPVLGYYIPRLTGQNFSLSQLTELGRLEGMAGFKFTDHNLALMQRLLVRIRDDQVVYNGPDEMLAFGLAFGAHGGIGTTYNVMPREILQIARHIANGKFAQAVAVQKRVNEVIELFHDFQGIAVTKQILFWQGLIDSTRCARPRARLTLPEQQELRRRLGTTLLADSLVR